MWLRSVRKNCLAERARLCLGCRKWLSVRFAKFGLGDFGLRPSASGSGLRAFVSNRQPENHGARRCRWWGFVRRVAALSEEKLPRGAREVVFGLPQMAIGALCEIRVGGFRPSASGSGLRPRPLGFRLSAHALGLSSPAHVTGSCPRALAAGPCHRPMSPAHAFGPCLRPTGPGGGLRAGRGGCRRR